MHSVTGSTAQRIAPESDLSAQFWPQGGVTFHGFGPKPRRRPGIERASSSRPGQSSTWTSRRRLVWDAQRYLGKKMWALSQPGGANTFILGWPAVANLFTWSNYTWGPAAKWTYRLWMDQTKKPLA